MKTSNTAIPVLQGQTYTIRIDGLGHSGEGVGKQEGFTVFVPGALPGEEVAARITEVKKQYARGEVVDILQASPDRAKPACPIYEQCGGCQLQHLSYSAQLAAKRQTVVDALVRIGKLEDVRVHPTLGAENPWNYRNKMQFPVSTADGKLIIGCFAQGTHEVVAAENCLIQSEANNRVAQEVRRILEEMGLPAYNEKTGKGLVRHVLGRTGTATGEVMAVIVTAAEPLPRKTELIERLTAALPDVVSIVQNINPRRTNIILGDQTRVLWGKETISDRLGEFIFEISAQSFFQVNTRQAEVLYDKAVEYAGLSGKETVIDAYCGAGTISLFLARQAKRVVGIEIVAPAIRNARQNAARNHVDNAEFIVGDAVDVLPKLYQQGLRPHAVVVDPPRAGCSPQVLETFVHMQPARIVYVSCNPASLARDLVQLTASGYQVQEVQPVDMFPQTSHVETVVLMSKVK